ncbi:hypothetical protein [Streptobacillus notomytis]|uniref:hypothetical protein n=1 Tax=Streptobacillus notomytis TaxID=1712031 RepID=UPI000AA7576A|nr:hypothetical protein [Streptobacillus notomytis]
MNFSLNLGLEYNEIILRGNKEIITKTESKSKFINIVSNCANPIIIDYKIKSVSILE